MRSGEAIGSLDAATLGAGYRQARITPVDVVVEVYDRIARSRDPSIWISLLPRQEALERAQALLDRWPDRAARPGLFGLPFAVKDNIDVAGLATTAACEEFSYVPSVSARLVDRLLGAGALLIGKANLDQFATGLTGTRSPYGTPLNPFDVEQVPGGSSSGSAVAVSIGQVTFAIGTDTAGSGRVPPALTNTVGIKPSRGLVSTAGMVPACRSLDCPSVVALTVADGALVLSAMSGLDPADPWSRDLPAPAATPTGATLAGLRLAVPEEDDLGLEPAGPYEKAYRQTLDLLTSQGVILERVSMAPFFEAGALLYGGAWIAERYAAISRLLAGRQEALHPVVRWVVEPGGSVSGSEVFADQHRLAELQRQVAPLWRRCAALLTPTVPGPVRIEEVLADPVRRNAALGRFTSYTNLLDLAAVALPAAFTYDGLPFGVTLAGPAGSDGRLADLAVALESLTGLPMGATGSARPAADEPASAPPPAPRPAHTLLAVVGAHLSGMPLHGELRALGATLEARTTTAPTYRLYALADTVPEKPGLLRVDPADPGSAAVEVEVYRIAAPALGQLMTSVPPPLAIGTIELTDGRTVHGFVCEPHALSSARDITEFGGWRRYRSAVGG